jgi:hypothetical protein
VEALVLLQVLGQCFKVQMGLLVAQGLVWLEEIRELLVLAVAQAGDCQFLQLLVLQEELAEQLLELLLQEAPQQEEQLEAMAHLRLMLQ